MSPSGLTNPQIYSPSWMFFRACGTENLPKVLLKNFSRYGKLVYKRGFGHHIGKSVVSLLPLLTSFKVQALYRTQNCFPAFRVAKTCALHVLDGVQ